MSLEPTKVIVVIVSILLFIQYLWEHSEFNGLFLSFLNFIISPCSLLGGDIYLTCYANVRRRQWHPTPVLLPGKSHGRRSLVGCSPCSGSELDTLSDFTFTFHFHAWEKEMATHSSVLPWRIPGTGEPGGLPSMGSHRVGHD